MRFFKSFLVALARRALGAEAGHAQPKISKDNVPPDLPQDVRTQIERLFSDNATQRHRAAAALGGMGEGALGAVPHLIAMLGDQDTGPARGATEALSKIGKAAGEACVAACKHRDHRVRAGAAETLDKIKDARTVDRLMAALGDPDCDVRDSAARALRWIKDARAVEPLTAALEDPDWCVRDSVAEALEATTGQRFGEDWGKWRKWWEKNKSTFGKEGSGGKTGEP